MPCPSPILERRQGLHIVLVVTLVCIRCLRTFLRVRRVHPFVTPPLSNAPLVRIKKSLPVMPGILEILVMPLAKAVVLVPLQILEQVPGQPRVLLVPLVHIHYLPTLRHVRPVLRVAKVPTRPQSRVLRAPIKLQPPVTLVTG